MEYRPDIDGLRAVAILFVLFFHAGFKCIPSGFVGVDVFFVISGFLITRIIHSSLQKGSFSFIDFYNRRLWRLQPIFIGLIITTLLLTLIFYLPEDLLQYSKSARKTSLFISNVFFENATKGYFAPNINQLPLLHTWSLSIEWQCYLILPVVIYLLHRMVAPKNISQVIYLLTVLFFVLALCLSVKEPTKTYFQLSSRIFEFLMGSCIVFSANRFAFNKIFLDLLNAVALLCLFYIATHNQVNAGFPNGYAFVLCLATATLIASGSLAQKPIIIRLLSIKPLVFIGLLSYSLYVWHWPVFVFIRYMGIEETPTVLLLALTLVFIIAYFSWRFIEKPARKLHKLSLGYTLTFLFIVPVLLLHLSDYKLRKHEGFPERFKEMGLINAQLKNYAYPQRVQCLQEKNIEVNNQCMLGATNADSKKGFLFGDSHANHLWGFMDNLARAANISILAHSTVSCLSLPGVQQYDWNKEVYAACHEQVKRYYAMIQANHYDFVILGQNWDGYLNNRLIPSEPVELVKKRIEKGLDKALQIIIASGSKPVLIKSIAVHDTYNCFLHHIKHRKKYEPQQCDFNMGASWQDDLFSRMQNKYAQLIIIDPRKVQCPQGKCIAEIKGIPVFRDSGHINDYASFHLASRYLHDYKNPLI